MTTIQATDIENINNLLWVKQKLDALRTLAKTSEQQAQEQAWQWIEELGKEDNQQALAILFGEGSVENPCVKTFGMPVGPMRNVPGGSIITLFLKIDSPWTGKTFLEDGSGGYNRVKCYSKFPVAFLAPCHRLHRDGDDYAGFRFDTSIKKGIVAPQVDVIAIEYAAPAYKNPSKLVPLTRVRDELVKILPHTYLGRATFPNASGEYLLVGYFALKSPITMGN